MRGILMEKLVSGVDELKVQDVGELKPKGDEYVIAVHAAATNFFDILQVTGKYQHQPQLPWIAGQEFAGVVLSVPAELPFNKTAKFKVGDRVCGGSQGAYAQRVTATEDRLRACPKGWSLFDAAGLFVTMPTSYAALVTRAGVKRGDWVLVHAAAGGVGLAAVQIAKAFGARVIGTAGTAHKLDVCRRFGADYVLDYRQKDWTERVKEITDGNGVDIVYDPVGLIDQSMKCIAWNGRLLVIGFAAGTLEKVGTNRILLKNVSVIGLHWGMYPVNEPKTAELVWDGIFDLIESGKVVGTSYTDREYVGLESIPGALKALGGRDSWGKVVVKIPQDGQSKI